MSAKPRAERKILIPVNPSKLISRAEVYIRTYVSDVAQRGSVSQVRTVRAGVVHLRKITVLV